MTTPAFEATPAPPTLVLGGGVAGLLCAWHLRRRGVPVEVWEAAAAPGGWVRTLAWEGGQAERGPQGLPRRAGDAADRLLRALGLPFEEIPHLPRWAGQDGRLVPIPAHGGAFLASPLLSLPGRLRLLAGLAWPIRARDDESLAAWTRRRFGTEVAERLLPLAARGLFATAAEELDAAVLTRRSGTRQVRLPGGMGSLSLALARDLDLRTGLRVRCIVRLPGGRWRVSGDGQQATATRVILALPAFEAAELLASHAPGAAAALREIPYASIENWHSLHAPVPPLASGHGFLVHPREGSDLLGCTVAHAGVDEARMHLRSFLPLGAGPWSAVDAALRRWVPDLPEAKAILRLEAPRALAAPPPGQRDRLARILGALPPGLDWVASARFGQGLGALIEGVEALITQDAKSRIRAWP